MIFGLKICHLATLGTIDSNVQNRNVPVNVKKEESPPIRRIHGDQIGQIFAFWAVLWKMTKVAQIFGLDFTTVKVIY
jgi:hypothetical protein